MNRYKIDEVRLKKAMSRYKIDEVIDFTITRHGVEPNLDRACEAALQRACMEFGVDDCGHINNVEGAERSMATIQVEFVTMLSYGGMGGWDHVYLFKAKVKQSDE